MVIDDKKIAFITCVNDEIQYAECRFYLDRLRIPEGYQVDRICIKEAPSLAAGYVHIDWKEEQEIADSFLEGRSINFSAYSKVKKAEIHIKAFGIYGR